MSRRGSALMLALWTIALLSLIVMAMAYRTRLEGELAGRYRFRMKAHALAEAGLEWSKLLLIKSLSPAAEEEEYGEDFRVQTLNLKNGLGLSGIRRELDTGSFTLSIQPEQGRRNINTLTRLDWERLLEQTGVPDERWDELRATFEDWVDANEQSQLNGAESDDAFYRDRGYKVKNAPIDTIDELLLIKGFEHAIVYGGLLEGERDPLRVSGIAPLLTVYGDGKVNLNTASRDVLLSLPEMNEDQVERILQGRLGLDGVAGTEDDGFRSVAEAVAYAGGNPIEPSRLTTTERNYIRVTSIGEAGDVRAGIWCIFEQAGPRLLPVFFRQEELP